MLSSLSDGFTQSFRLKNYSIGYRIAEQRSPGDNPGTLAPVLKDPESYQSYIDGFRYNGTTGGAGIFTLHSFFLNTEWQKNNPQSDFWKKYSVTVGLFITSKISQSAGAIQNTSNYPLPDTGFTRVTYMLTKNQQSLGINAGLNRRWALAPQFAIIAGLHAQGAVAIIHQYNPQFEVTTSSPSRGFETTLTHLEPLKAKNFLHWQIMIPAGIEYTLLRQQLFIRAELNLGIAGGPYSPVSWSDKAFAGAGAWLIWQPVQIRRP